MTTDSTILIVDDDEGIVKLLALTLKRHVNRVLTAENGKKGLEILATEKIHCVLSDIKMPVMDGITFIKEARAMGCQVPFIFFTGYGSEQHQLEALRYGAFDFIEKPEFENVESAVKNGIESSFKSQDSSSNSNFLSDYQKLVRDRQKP